MVGQYTDIATIPGKTAEATKVNGVITPGLQGADIVIKGRYEPSTLERELFTIDGKETKIKGIYYCPLNTPDVDRESFISVINKKNEVVLTKEKVLFFSRGQMNCRLYI